MLAHCIYIRLPVFDGAAGLAISGLLASMGLVLVRINQRYLLGQAVDPEITSGIEKILMEHKSIDSVHSIQSQWTGPDTFSFKAEVDFDGTYLAAKIMPRYQNEFLQVQDSLDSELGLLLCWYAEDVMRTVEREVKVSFPVLYHLHELSQSLEAIINLTFCFSFRISACRVGDSKEISCSRIH